jgi:hypothetical protein
MLIEIWWNRMRARRNAQVNSSETSAKIGEAHMKIATMKQAWADTSGGRLSPPAPW